MNNPSGGGAVALGGGSHHHVVLSIGWPAVHVGGDGYALGLRPQLGTDIVSVVRGVVSVRYISIS